MISEKYIYISAQLVLKETYLKKLPSMDFMKVQRLSFPKIGDECQIVYSKEIK